MAPKSKASQLKPKGSLGNVLVIGGCGFLGHHIIDLLLTSYTGNFSVLDLRTTRNRRPDSDGVAYYDGDITDLNAILPIFQKVKPDVVIHTASPVAATTTDNALYYKVNVEGTKTVIEACQKSNVKALVYTSSASVISDNSSDLINADERWPIVPQKKQTEYYSTTKAQAEALVLEANRAAPYNLLTTSLRPAGIFGEGDMQAIPGMLNAYHDGKTGFQLGENNNLFDWTYVTNVAHGHLLAAQALLHTSSLKIAPLDHEKVDGETFFITNDAPVYFWDFARAVWKAAGDTREPSSVWVISKDTGMFIGSVLEWGMWLVGRKPKLTVRQVKYSCMTRYYDCGKAKRRFGYKPLYTVSEGVKRAVAWFEEERIAEAGRKSQ